jgi:hypothetical protein
LGWVGPQSEGKAANKCSAYVGTPSRLLKNIPHEGGWENAKSVQSCHQSKEWLFEEYKIYFDFFNTSLVTAWFHVLFHSFDLFIIILQCRK